MISRLICTISLLTHSITSRVESLVSLSLEISVLSTKAFNLLTGGNIHLIRRMMNIIAKYAAPVFESKDPVLLNRLAMLTQFACLQCPDEMLTKCGFVFDFIPFCHHRSVLEMFACFLPTVGGEKTMKLRRHLASAHFPGRLLEVVQSTDASLHGDPMDPTAGMLTGIFRLIANLRPESALGLPLVTPDAMDILSRDFQEPPVLLLDAQWDAVRACVVPENAFILAQKLSPLIALFRDRSDGFFGFQSAILRTIPRSSEAIRTPSPSS
jgi:hypothetical protein